MINVRKTEIIKMYKLNVATNMEESRRISETIRLGTILSVSGGFLDAYSYLIRGGVLVAELIHAKIDNKWR